MAWFAQLAGFTGMALAAAFIALYAVLGKILLNHAFDGFVFLSHRQLLAAAIMLPIALCVDGARDPRPHWRQLALLSALFSANIGGFLIGLQLTSAFAVIIMQFAIPGAALLLDWLLSRKRPRNEAILWTAIATFGALTAVLGTRMQIDGSAHHRHPPHHVPLRFALGVGVLLAQCIAFALFVVAQKRALESWPAFSLVAWTHTGSAVLCTAVAAATGPPARLWAGGTYASAADAAILGYAALFGTVGSFLLMAYATKVLPAALVSTVFTSLEPVWVTIFQWVLLGESLSAVTVAGDVVATVAVLLLGRLQMREHLANISKGRTEPEAASLTVGSCAEERDGAAS